MLLDYRKDIDGLRAIAVMLVVLFHAGLPITGGFVGVDVFFVISGFLITSLIQKQILRDKFTFKSFYLHRMRRILPALLSVILVVFLFSCFVLMPIDFRFLVRSIFYSIVSFSNIFFYQQGNQYFTSDSDNIQLLHTWSLSVEEQFYILIPIFLIILFKYFYKTKWFNVILAVLLVSSFGVSIHLANNNASFAYYLLPARFFELFIGVTLALNYSKLPVSKNNLVNNILGVFGLGIIIAPAFMITKESVFPGLNALYVCLGAAIIIYLGKTEKQTFVNKFLSIKPMVGVGLISYSLYLWHWPVFATINILGIKLTIFQTIMMLLGITGISYLSWRFIEQPFRNNFKWNFRKTFVLLFILPVVVFSVIKITSKQTNTFADYRFSGDLLKYVKTSGSKSQKVERFCHAGVGENMPSVEKCYLGNSGKKDVDVLLIGDSHANAFSGFLDVLLKDVNLRGMPMTYSDTMFLKNIEEKDLGKLYTGNSKEKTKKSLENFKYMIQNNNYRYVVMAGFYSKYYKGRNFDTFAKRFKESIRFVISKGAIPVIVHDILILENLPYCKLLKERFGLNQKCYISRDKYLSQHNKMLDFLAKLLKEFPQIKFIKTQDVMCQKTECLVEIDNVGLYYDKNHLSYSGSKLLGKKYLAKYGNPFKENIE